MKTRNDGAYTYRADDKQAAKVNRADHFAQRYLGDYNERIERLGYEDEKARRLYEKCQYWLDRYHNLIGNA